MTDDVSSYEPARLLAELKSKASEEPPTDFPNRLPLAAIKQIRPLFQIREMDERHVSELARVLANGEELDPVTVIQVGRETVLIDGHHRLAAYAATKRTADIPVRYFTGSLKEALLEAGAGNSKAKLPMTSQERQDFAWRLQLIGGYSKVDIARASGVSTSQVAIMRKAKRSLGEEAFSYDSWWRARRAWQGYQPEEISLDDEGVWLEEQATRYADRLAKEFSSKLSNNLEVAARALAIYFGRRLPEIVEELRGHLPKPDDIDWEGDDDF
ncbi:MAG TPA: ParB/RepB/Spo0J family partition protein [Microvirga sp.]|jgi:hypothetical protein|nr:ParB/RepB/Spo0J family partition protein [Microvirga sp.]